MNWVHHYTGHDYAEAHRGPFNIYLNRDSKSQRLTFVRVCAFRRMLGLFIGTGNYVKGIGGWELFTNKYHLGWSKPWGRSRVWVEWSGSSAQPFYTFTVRVGSFGWGRRSPKWLERWKSRREHARLAAIYAEEEAEHTDDLAETVNKEYKL